MKLGKPKYEQNNKNYFAFRKDQNTFTLRILPPMGELAESGKWSVYHRVEFGHTGTDNRMKPFLSPRVVNYDGMVEVESQSHIRREQLKTKMEAAKASGDLATQEECNTLLRKYNQDAKHYMNAVDLQGNVGLFKIGHRGYQALKAEIDRIRKTDGVEPVGIENGRFFVFSRSGKGRDTIYTVQEYKQKQEMIGPNGDKIVADVTFNHSVDEKLLNKLETDAFELNKVYPTVTAEQEARIVSEGATAVDEILGRKTQGKTETNSVSTSTQTEVAPTPNVTNTNQVQANNEVVNVTTGEITPQTTAQVETVIAPTNSVSGMSEEDFFKKIEQGDY